VVFSPHSYLYLQIHPLAVLCLKFSILTVLICSRGIVPFSVHGFDLLVFFSSHSLPVHDYDYWYAVLLWS